MTSSPAGISCGATCSAGFKDNEAVILTGTPATGTAPAAWAGCEKVTLDNKCKVTMSAAGTVTATFDLAQRELKVTKAGTGSGTVTSSPTGISCGATCTTTFVNGTTVVLSAVSGLNSGAVAWSGCTKVIEVSGEKQCEVSMTTNKAIVATFNLNQVELKVALKGTGTGKVASSPAGIECGAKCAVKFGEGSTVTLTGTPGANTEAAKWTGCTSVNAEDRCLVAMSGAREVTATFNHPQFPLSVTRVGPGTGTVTSIPAGIECGSTCSAGFDKESAVVLTSVSGLHSELALWSGCDAVTGANECEVKMSAARGVTATFDLQPGFTLEPVTVEKAGTGEGSVTSSPAGIECGPACAAEYVTGTVLTLSAEAAPGSVFSHWSGGGCGGAPASCAKTINGPLAVKAVFTAVGTRTLSLTLSGPGSVKSKAAGIECSASCAPQVAAGKTIVLSAKAAAGSTFSGFSGACTGTKACKVKMSEAHSVTATFAKAPVSVPPSATATVAAKAKVKGGKALVRVSCAAAGPSCRGSLKLFAKLKGKGKATAIGSGTFSLAPGSSTTLKIALSARAKQALKATGKLKARVGGEGIQGRAVHLKA